MSVVVERGALPTAAELVGVLVVRLDGGGRVVAWNEACCHATGLTEAAAVGLALPELARAAPRSVLQELPTTDGRTCPVAWTTTPGEDGQVVAAGVVLADPPEASGRPTWDRSWFRAFADIVPLPLLLLDAAERVYFNRPLEDLLGIPLEPERGTEQYRSRIFRRDGTPLAGDLPTSGVLRTGVPVEGEEYVVERPDGSRITVLASIAPILDPTGRPTAVVGVFQDLTDRAAREEAIRANERLLDGIFELLPVGVWIADRAGTIVRGNPAGLRIWAGRRYVPSDDGPYRAWWAETGEPVRHADWALSRAVVRRETVIGEVVRIRAFDGTCKTIKKSALPLHDARGELVGAILVDEEITAQRAVEDALRRALVERDRVLAFVSHDLRNLVSTVTLGAQLLSRTLAARDDAASEREMVDRIVGAGRMMARLIADLLDVVSIESGELSIARADVGVKELLDEVVLLHRPTAAAAEVDLTVGACVAGTVSADRDRILQVLSNLVGNALKFTPAGGRVAVSASRADGDLVFAVSDTGPGIPRDIQQHLFEPFWRADPCDRRGVGLGLAIAKGIVAAHGGRIGVDSDVGRGAVFWFRLPGR